MPSPKVQDQLVMVPSVSMDESVKVATRSAVALPKLAVGATLAAVTVTEALAVLLLAPSSSVTVSVTL